MYFGNIWNTVVTCMLVLQFCNIELQRHSLWPWSGLIYNYYVLIHHRYQLIRYTL